MENFRFIGAMVSEFRFFKKKKKKKKNMDNLWKSYLPVFRTPCDISSIFLHTVTFSHVLHLDIIRTYIKMEVKTYNAGQPVWCARIIFTCARARELERVRSPVPGLGTREREGLARVREREVLEPRLYTYARCWYKNKSSAHESYFLARLQLDTYISLRIRTWFLALTCLLSLNRSRKDMVRE